jgi:hypothetical protein
MTSQKPASWAYAEEFVTENPVVEQARRRGEELGAPPVGNGAGVVLRLLAAAAKAKSVVEIGTGAGITEKVTVGTKAKPVPQAAAAPAGANSGAAAPAMMNEAMWDKIAQCESTGNWSINSGNGYYGGLQFDVQTWIGAGGGAYAPNASLATKAQQIDIANRVYAQRGLSPWGCGWAASR